MKTFYSLLVSLLCCMACYAQDLKKSDPYALSFYNQAVETWKRGQHDSAFSLTTKAMNLARSSKDSVLLAKCLNNIGLIYSKKGDPIKSIYYYEQSLEILKSQGDERGVLVALLNMGIFYKTQRNHDKALELLFEAAIGFEKIQDSMYLSSAYNTIGNIFRIEKRYDKALEYLSFSLKLRREINYNKGIAGSLNNIGTVYMALENYDSALIYFNQSLKLKDLINLPEERASALSHIAEIHYLKHNYALAEKYFLEVHQVYKQSNNKLELAASYFDLARLNHALAAYTLSEQQALKAISLSEETGALDIKLKCYDLLKKIYTSRKNFTKALEYAELFMVLNDSLSGAEKQKSLAQLEVRYETLKKLREIELLNQEKQKTQATMVLKDLQLEAKNTYSRNLLIILILLGSSLVLLLLLVRNRNRFAKKLDSVIRELHHRVKNNFQVLLSLFNLQLSTIQDENTKDLINSNRNRITAMMLIHSGLYFDEDVTKVKIGNYIQNLVNNLLVIYGLQSSNIRMVFDVDEELDIDVDKSIPLGLLINELVTNALKYAYGAQNKDPFLRIYFRKTQGTYHLIIQDNGPGLESGIQKRSFGLKLVDNQVKQLKGILNSKVDQGLTHDLVFE